MGFEDRYTIGIENDPNRINPSYPIENN